MGEGKFADQAAYSDCQSTESDLLLNEQLRESLKALKDSENAVEILKLILNQLNEDQCKQIYSHLGVQTPSIAKSEKDHSLQMQKYQDEIHQYKTEWMALRDQNK